MEKEIRSLDSELAELRSEEDSREISGYGIVFNKESKLIQGSFTEVVLPEAVDGLFEKSDVFAYLNHDTKKGHLANSSYTRGSMKLTKDEKGVKYSFVAPPTAIGDEAVEGVKSGKIHGSSFGFTLSKGGATVERRSDGTYLRTIRKFDSVFDMSPVYNPAYLDTTVALRSLEEFTESEKEEVRAQLEAEAVTAETVASVSVEEVKPALVLDYSKYETRINNQKI